MFHSGKKRKPLNCLFYWCWPVIVTIMKIDLFLEGSYRLASIFISYSAASKFIFHFWSNSGWLIYFIRGSTYALKMLIIISFLSVIFLDIGRMRTCICQQVLQCVWSGRNCGRTYHEVVWIICYFWINYVFYLKWKFF